MRGLRTRPFGAARVTAIDVDPAMAAKARRRLTAYGHRYR
jgi:trans-aconitate methyltransferase